MTLNSSPVSTLQSITYNPQQRFPTSSKKWDAAWFLLALCKPKVTQLTHHTKQGNEFIYKDEYWRAVCKDNWARLLSVVPDIRTGGNGHKVQHKKLHLNISKHFCAVCVAHRHWVVSLLTDLQKAPGLGPVHRALGVTAWARHGPDEPWGPINFNHPVKYCLLNHP